MMVGCTGGDALPGDEADSCPAEFEVQKCDVACVSDLEVNATFSTCATELSPMCFFACLDLPDGTKECGCCHDRAEGEIRTLRWKPCL